MVVVRGLFVGIVVGFYVNPESDTFVVWKDASGNVFHDYFDRIDVQIACPD